MTHYLGGLTFDPCLLRNAPHHSPDLRAEGSLVPTANRGDAVEEPLTDAGNEAQVTLMGRPTTYYYTQYTLTLTHTHHLFNIHNIHLHTHTHTPHLPPLYIHNIMHILIVSTAGGPHTHTHVAPAPLLCSWTFLA